MPRQARSTLGDGYFHITSRGVNRCDIFIDDTDRRTFLALLGLVVRRFEWTCHTFCLMTTHYHLILETTGRQLSRGMGALNGAYAQRFNKRYGREGQLFGSRFRATPIESEEHLHAACEYVLDNPVRAGLCPSRADWAWSGRPSLT